MKKESLEEYKWVSERIPEERIPEMING